MPKGLYSQLAQWLTQMWLLLPPKVASEQSLKAAWTCLPNPE